MSTIAHKSGVWEYFKRLDPNEAECNLCTAVAKTKRIKITRGSTTGLHRHLEAQHIEEYCKVVQKKVCSLSNTGILNIYNRLSLA